MVYMQMIGLKYIIVHKNVENVPNDLISQHTLQQYIDSNNTQTCIHYCAEKLVPFFSAWVKYRKSKLPILSEKTLFTMETFLPLCTPLTMYNYSSI